MPSTIVQKMTGLIIILIRLTNRVPSTPRACPISGASQPTKTPADDGDDHRRCTASGSGHACPRWAVVASSSRFSVSVVLSTCRNELHTARRMVSRAGRQSRLRAFRSREEGRMTGHRAAREPRRPGIRAATGLVWPCRAAGSAAVLDARRDADAATGREVTAVADRSRTMLDGGGPASPDPRRPCSRRPSDPTATASTSSS